MVASKTAYEAQFRRAAQAELRGGAAATGTVTVTPHNAEGAWLITLEGEHDLSTAALLEQETIGLWQNCTLAVVDVSGAAFIDSTVVNWLMSAKHMLEASGGGLGIVEGPPGSFAARLFGLLRLRDVLGCYSTRRDALAQVHAPAPTPAGRAWVA